jgi:hypothetical protein
VKAVREVYLGARDTRIYLGAWDTRISRRPGGPAGGARGRREVYLVERDTRIHLGKWDTRISWGERDTGGGPAADIFFHFDAARRGHVVVGR